MTLLKLECFIYFEGLFETGPHYVVQARLELTVMLLTQPPECEDYRRGHHAQTECIKEKFNSVVPLRDSCLRKVGKKSSVCCYLKKTLFDIQVSWKLI